MLELFDEKNNLVSNFINNIKNFTRYWGFFPVSQRVWDLPALGANIVVFSKNSPIPVFHFL